MKVWIAFSGDYEPVPVGVFSSRAAATAAADKVKLWPGQPSQANIEEFELDAQPETDE